MAPASPEGILIGNPRKPWRVGQKIGSGACATVHELEFHGKTGTAIPEVEYVIKIAPLPKGKTNPKKKKTEVEHNANLLYYENLMYMTQLPHLQGKLIPRVPSMADSNAPPFFGDEEGFRFIVMERMEAPMMDVVPALLDRRNKRAGGKIPFGPVAAALLDCVEALHDKNHLFVDMKTENFMLAAERGRGKRKTSSLADRVRMIDLGLVKPLKNVTLGGHRTDEGADLIGTPLYASLNVHEGHTLSRRDDLEALGYVISELLIALIAASTGARSSKKKAAAFLPWSNGKSDDEIYELKKNEVTDPKSTFYSRLGAQNNADVARIMRQYFERVQNIGYKQEPDYESLRDLLLGLNVSGASTSKAAARAPKSEETTRRRTTARGTKRNHTCLNTKEEDGEEEFKETPSKVHRVASIDDDDSVQDVFQSCKEDDEEEMDDSDDESMDDTEDVVDDEPEVAKKPAAKKRTPTKKSTPSKREQPARAAEWATEEPSRSHLSSPPDAAAGLPVAPAAASIPPPEPQPQFAMPSPMMWAQCNAMEQVLKQQQMANHPSMEQVRGAGGLTPNGQEQLAMLEQCQRQAMANAFAEMQKQSQTQSFFTPPAAQREQPRPSQQPSQQEASFMSPSSSATTAGVPPEETQSSHNVLEEDEEDTARGHSVFSKIASLLRFVTMAALLLVGVAFVNAAIQSVSPSLLSVEQPPCFVSSGGDEASKAAPNWLPEKGIDACRRPLLPCPERGVCSGGFLRSCTDSDLRVSESGDDCVFTDEASVNLAKLKAALVSLTVDRMCSWHSCNLTVVDDEAVAPMFVLSEVLAHVRREEEINDMDESFLSFANSTFQVKEATPSGGGTTLLVGLSDYYVKNELDVPWDCWLFLLLSDMLTCVWSGIVLPLLWMLSVVGDFLWNISKENPIVTFVTVMILGMVGAVGWRNRKRATLLADVAQIRELALNKLQNQADPTYGVLVLRDQIAWDITSKKRRDYVIRTVWPRVVNDVKKDNRVLKTTKLEGDKLRDVWKWVAPKPTPMSNNKKKAVHVAFGRGH